MPKMQEFALFVKLKTPIGQETVKIQTFDSEAKLGLATLTQWNTTEKKQVIFEKPTVIRLLLIMQTETWLLSYFNKTHIQV